VDLASDADVRQALVDAALLPALHARDCGVVAQVLVRPFAARHPTAAARRARHLFPVTRLCAK
jgi:hypothetical protein